jgi:hypothetical protein
MARAAFAGSWAGTKRYVNAGRRRASGVPSDPLSLVSLISGFYPV